MRVINKEELEQHEHSLLKEIKKTVFIYPTDSIYGIGCDATNEKLVTKVRELKNSTLQAFSVIAPNKKWIYQNCEVTKQAEEWIEKLGQPVTIDGKIKGISLILKLNNEKAVAANVLQGKETISIRIPDHWFSSYVEIMNTPIVTTSANPTGGNFMTNLENLHERIKDGVPYCIYEGEKNGTPSTLIHLHKEEIEMKKR